MKIKLFVKIHSILILIRFLYFLYFSGKDNAKSTAANPVVDFEECLKIVKQKVIPLVKPRPITLKQKQISAFSYYYDRAIETGLVGKFYYL